MSTRRWPLLILALPAMVAIWSGWVGLGGMSGFGPVHPLPGIADGFTINSAITLPIGMEAYAAYALGAWLSPGTLPGRARRFAAWSAVLALGLGLLGQVIYHVLTADHAAAAPLVVVIFVACLPVLVLGAGATLHHLMGAEAESVSPFVATDQVVESTQPDVPGRATEPAEPEPAELVAELVAGRSTRAELAKLDTVADRARLAAERTGITRPIELAAWLAESGYPDHSPEAIRSALRRGPVEPVALPQSSNRATERESNRAGEQSSRVTAEQGSR